MAFEPMFPMISTAQTTRYWDDTGGPTIFHGWAGSTFTPDTWTGQGGWAQGTGWIPTWAGEVITAYDQYNCFEPLVTHRTIESGVSIRIPVAGTVGLNPGWEAGVELSSKSGTDTGKMEAFEITLDKRPMAAYFEVDNIDLLITQIDYRSELARQAAKTLSYARDMQIASLIRQAAAVNVTAGTGKYPAGFFGQGEYVSLGATSTLSGTTPGANSRVLSSDFLPSDGEVDIALTMLECIENAQLFLMELNAPTDHLYCALLPKQFKALRSLGVADNVGITYAGDNTAGYTGMSPYGQNAQGAFFGEGVKSTALAYGNNLNYLGCMIMPCQHIPTKNYTTGNVGTGILGDAKYDINGTGTVGLIWAPESVAAVTKQGLNVRSFDDVRRNSVFTVASMFGGGDILRPEFSFALVDNT